MDRNKLREKLIADMKANPPSSTSHFTQWCRQFNYVDLVQRHTSYLPDSCKFTERIYHIFHNLTEKPKCKYCQNQNVKFVDINIGYREYCSRKCTRLGGEEKIKQTNLQRYATEWASQSDEFKEKCKETCLNKYGKEFVTQTDQMKEKSKETVENRYGVSHVMLNEEFKEKVREKVCKTNRTKAFERIVSSNRLNDHYELLVDSSDYYGVRIGDTNKSAYYPFRCKKCSTEFYDHLVSGNIPRCPTCYPFSTSTGETEVVEFCRKYYPDLLNGTYSVIPPQQLDVYIPEINLAIEYNGLYWHSETSGGKDKYNHQGKSLKCLQNSINLLHIFEDEWTNKRSIVESILLNRFGKIRNRVYARQCQLTTVNNQVARDFYGDNHIAGYVNGTTFGLVYNNELVSAITVGRPRFGSSHSLEIYRFCSKLNNVVVGGFSKLLRNVFKYMKPTSIVTFADLRYGLGSVYKKAGFKYLGVTEPNYYYFKHNQRFSRNAFQKPKLESQLELYDSTLTEWENMQLNGYDRIWDCGHVKYELEVQEWL